jgi:hypothetical protein
MVVRIFVCGFEFQLVEARDDAGSLFVECGSDAGRDARVVFQ